MLSRADIQISTKDIYDDVRNNSDEDCAKYSYLKTATTAVIFPLRHRAATGKPRRQAPPSLGRDQHHRAVEQEHKSEEHRYHPTKEVADPRSRHRTTIAAAARYFYNKES
jgi:hypothetical protein